MAKRKSSRTTPQPESKRGLVVTLVFFILATIGLGVATYYGFAEKDKLVQAAKKADDAAKAANAERDMYRFLANYTGAYAGVEPENRGDLGVDKQAFESGSLGRGSSNQTKIATKTKETLDKLQKAIPWDPGTNQPMTKDGKPSDLFKLIQQRDAAIAQLVQEKKLALEAKTKAEADLARAKEELASARTKFEEEVKNLEKGNAKNLAEYLRKVAAAETDFKKVNDDKFDKAKELADQVIGLEKDKRALEKIIRDQRDRLGRLESIVAQKKEAQPVKLKPLGKVIRVSADGKRAYIDVGSNDGLKSQVTFSIYELAANGQPKAEPKGTVEVTEVGPRTSVVAITRMFAPQTERDFYGRRVSIDVLSKENINPIQRGDVIVNPTWNPNLKTHIAIAGIVDFIGDGANHVVTFVRNLEKQNIIVDAYMDPRDGSIKGPGISQKTDMLVLASAPDFGEFATGANKARAENFLKVMATLQKDAEKNGLSQIKLRRFIEDIGYRVPRYAQRRTNVPGITAP